MTWPDITGANADYAGLFSLRFSGWRKPPVGLSILICCQKAKTLFRIIGAPCFIAMLCILTGCSLRYQKPSGLISRIAIANRVVATNRLINFANPLGSWYSGSSRQHQLQP